MEKITINIPFEIDQEFVDDVMCTALEGGISYWAKILDVDVKNVTEKYEYLSDAVSRGAVIHFGDVEEEEDDSNWFFGLDEFIKGVTLYLQRKGHALEPQTDPGYIDVDHADVIVQLGLFGEVVYG